MGRAEGCNVKERCLWMMFGSLSAVLWAWP